jgi:hypothetical protein
MGMAASEASMAAMQQQSEQFQLFEQQMNLQNAMVSAQAQFGNSCSDSIKSAAK